jgi:rhamnopyranosyl-N-acetylglucosaminyl-diphospho-decaprenol beta-1,3/1,4-galactofuranosyltransferase
MAVCAVVVTHNRRALLTECLAALRAQTRPADHVLVVDNASTDGTPQMVREEHPDLELVALEVNGGASGGFHEGLRRAHEAGFDWIWSLDDDTMPESHCLEWLLRAAAELPETPLLLSSQAVWTDGHLHPMNQQGFERLRTGRVIEAAEHGLMPLRTATFVSLLLHRQAIDRHGLPLRRFFLWSDDIEFTARILRHDAGYLVPASIALHKTQTAHTAINAAPERFYFHVRNSLYMLRGTAWAPSEKPSLVFSLLVSVAAFLKANRFSPSVFPIILRGLRDGLRPGAPTPARP